MRLAYTTYSTVSNKLTGMRKAKAVKDLSIIWMLKSKRKKSRLKTTMMTTITTTTHFIRQTCLSSVKMKTHSKRGLRPTYLPIHGTDLKVVPCSWLPSFSANAKQCPASGPYQLPDEQANLHAKDKQMNWCFLCFLLFLRQGLIVLALPGLKVRLASICLPSEMCAITTRLCVCICAFIWVYMCVIMSMWVCVGKWVYVVYVCVCASMFLWA